MTLEIDPETGNRNWTNLVRMDGEIAVSIDNAPLNWLTDNKQRPSDEWLATQGFYGFEPAPSPSFDPKTHRAEANPVDEGDIDHQARTVTQTWTIVPLTAGELAAMRQLEERAVDEERDRRMYGGLIFSGHLFQTRPEDQKRIAGAGTLALAAIVQGAEVGDLRWHGGAEDFEWIAADNTVVAMDAQTVFAFGQAAAAWERAHIFAARTIKSMETIPANFTDNSFWPELT